MIEVVTSSKRRLAPRPFIARALVSLTAVYLAVAIVLNANTDSYRLDLSRVGGLADVVAAFSLAFLCGAVGWELLGRRVSAGARPFSLLGSCVVVGIGGLGTILLGLGWLGLYQPWILVAALLACAVFSLRHSSGWLHTCGRAFRRLRRLAHGVYGVTWLGIQVVGIAALLLMALAPITDWDSLMYHLDLPIEFLEEGRMLVPEDNRHFSFLSPVHLTYLIPLAAGLPQAVSVFTLIGFLLFLLATVELGRRLGGLVAARVAGLLVWVSTAFVLVAVDARVEIWTVCLVVLALYWGFQFLDHGRSRGPIRLLLGVVGGLALTVKVTAMPVVVGVLLLVALFDYRRHGRVGAAILPMGLAALVWAPWLIKNVFALGDPVFPLLSERGSDTWLVSLGVTQVPGIGLLGAARAPFSLFDWLVDPGRVTIEGSGAFQGLPWLVALGWIPALVLAGRGRRAAAILVALAVAQVVAVVGFRTNTNLRYLLPAVALLTLASALGLAAASRKSLWAERLVIVLVGISLLGTTTHVIGSVADGRSSLILTDSSPAEWLRTHQTGYLIELDRTLKDERANLAILLFEARAAGFETPVLQDNVDTTWQAMTTLPLLECPSLGGATHLVVNEWHLDYFSRRGVDLNEAHWDEFGPYAEKCLEVSAVVGPYRVYVIEEGT